MWMPHIEHGDVVGFASLDNLARDIRRRDLYQFATEFGNQFEVIDQIALGCEVDTIATLARHLHKMA